MKPFAVDQCWSVFSRDPVARVLASTWTLQSANFFGASLHVVQVITSPDGVLPSEASFEVDLAPLAQPASRTRVVVVTLPLELAPDALAAAHKGVEAIGGAGMDALLARAERIWQVRRSPLGVGDARAPLVVAGVMASVLLGPVLPPDEVTVYGVKGVRVRLDALGWRT